MRFLLFLFRLVFICLPFAARLFNNSSQRIALCWKPLRLKSMMNYTSTHLLSSLPRSPHPTPCNLCPSLWKYKSFPLPDGITSHKPGPRNVIKCQSLVFFLSLHWIFPNAPIPQAQLKSHVNKMWAFHQDYTSESYPKEKYLDAEIFGY